MLVQDVATSTKPQNSSGTVDDINPALPLRTLNYGNYGIFPIMGNAGFISSTVRLARMMNTTSNRRPSASCSAYMGQLVIGHTVDDITPALP